MLASCSVEADQIAELYDADPARIRIVAPGVDHAFFGPGDRPQARRALGLAGEGPLLLFVGRIQPLKGVDGGRADPGRPRAATTPTPGWWSSAARAGPRARPRSTGRWRWWTSSARPTGCVFVPPQPHELLSTYYRAADVCLVPSRSESFGLVALEAAACGTPVVASDVGGLRSLIDHGRTGYLVEEPTPRPSPPGCARSWPSRCWPSGWAPAAVLRARRYTWARAARLLRDDLRRADGRPPGRVLVTDRWSGVLGAEERAAVVRRHRRAGRGGSWPPAARWWPSTARPGATRSPGRPAGTCGSGATRRSSSRCG